MRENPYEPSREPARLETPDRVHTQSIRVITREHRQLGIYTLLHLASVAVLAVGRMLSWVPPVLVGAGGLLITWCLLVLCIRKLSAQVFARPLSSVLTVVAVTPIVGFFIAWLVQTRANGLLRQQGIEVGFLGPPRAQ